jgi:GTP cyclohydrolase I
MAMTETPAEDLPPGAAPDPIEAIARALLIELGEDPDREGLRDTPKRYARWWREFTSYDPGATDRVFESVVTGQLVAVSGMEVWSICEHHLLPFSCSLSIAYVTREHILGLSKFARIAHAHAHRLQVQERLVQDIADEIEKVTGSPDLAVIGRGEHLCMTMRGVRTSALMTSTVWRGQFSENAAMRAEVLNFRSPA